MKPAIYLAADHAGFEYKNEIRDWLIAQEYSVEDCGAYTLDEEDDFPDFVEKAAAAVAEDPNHRMGIIFGGSGQGEAMLANRHQGVRAAVYYGGSEDIVTLSREHNNANVLSLGARFISLSHAKEVIFAWLATAPLPDKKYARRNNKIKHITKALRGLFGRR